MKKYLIALLLAPLALLGGCSDDGDDGPVDLPLLFGRWECYKEYDEEYDLWDYDFGEGVDVCRYEFRENGRGAYRFDDYVDRWIPFSYVVEGDMLLLVEDGSADYEAERIRIDRLTSSELVLAFDYEGEDGRDYTDKEYYRRID